MRHIVTGVSWLATEFHRVHAKVRPILGTCLYALAAGIAAVGFQLAINWLYGHTFKNAAAVGPGQFLWVSLVTIVGSSLIVGVR